MIPPSIMNRPCGNSHFNALDASISRGNVETTLQLINYGAESARGFEYTMNHSLIDCAANRCKYLKGRTKMLDFSQGMEAGCTLWESEAAKLEYNQSMNRKPFYPERSRDSFWFKTLV